MCGTNMQSLFYLIKDRCTLNKYIVFSNASVFASAQIITVCIYVCLMWRRNMMWDHSCSLEYKMILCEEQQAWNESLHNNRTAATKKNVECTNNLPMGVIIVVGS